MRYLPGNAQHIGARKEQQDAFAFSDPANKKFLAHAGLLAVVSDGMGGLAHGQQASSAAVRAFLTGYERKSRQETIPAAMHRGLEAAFHAVQGLNQGGGGQGGATLAAAVAHENQLYWVSVGDSRLYLLRRGHLVQLSRDHSYRERLFDQVAGERLGLEDALSNPEREHLTSYLGVVGSPEVDGNVKPFFLEPEDYVLLCTDGVYRSLSDREFVSAFAGGSASQGCEAIKAMVLARATQQQDNLTVVAFRCEGQSAAAAISNLRPKVVVGAACLLFCANLLAADLAWNTLRKQNYVPKSGTGTEQKDLIPGPSNNDPSEKKPSPMKPGKDTPHQEPTAEPAAEQQDPGAIPPETNSADKDTAGGTTVKKPGKGAKKDTQHKPPPDRN